MFFAETLAPGVAGDPRLHVVQRDSDLGEWERRLVDCAKRGIVGWDTETSGLNWFRRARVRRARIIGHCWGYDDGTGRGIEGCYMPIRHQTPDAQLDPDKVTAVAQKVLGDSNHQIAAHNAKFDMHFGEADGITIRAWIHDTLVQSTLVDENQKKDLETLAVRWGVDPNALAAKSAVKDFFRKDCTRRGIRQKDAPGYAFIPVGLLGPYGCKDGMNTKALCDFFMPAMQSHWWSLYITECKLLRVFQRAEHIGTPLDLEYLYDLHERMTKKAERILERMHHLAGYQFNPGSDEEIRQLIYGHLKQPVEHWTSGGGKDRFDGNKLPSTGAVALRAIIHRTGSPLVQNILDWREVTKITSTYTTSMIEKTDDNGYLHGTFNQVKARTGRTSSDSPNLQNISSDDPDKMDQSVKRAFLVPKGKVRLFMDFSQIELRVLASLSQEPTMIQAFIDGEDVHSATSIRMFGNDDKVNRRIAKCFHPDTEVLSRSGWKRILDLGAGEEIVQAVPDGEGVALLEWAVPTEVFSTRHPSGELVHLRNEGMDLRVTPDHRMLVWGSTGAPEVVLPDEVAKARHWANGGLLFDDDHGAMGDLDERLVRLAVATQANGSYSGNCIRFGFSRRRKIMRLRGLLGSLPHWEERGPDKKGVTWFVLRPALATPIRALLDEKRFGWSLLGLTFEDRRVLVDESRFWDSCVRPSWRMFRYSSSIEQNVDVLQALAASVGLKTRKVRDAAKDHWCLTVRDKATSRGGNLDCTRSKYDGEVACLSVPGTFVLVRDGGVPVLTGQTVNFGVAYGLSDIGLMNNINKVADPSRGVPTINQAEAQKHLAHWHSLFPGVGAYIDWLVTEMARHRPPSFTNIFGRTRRIPEILAFGSQGRRAARQAIASMIQGTANELMKISMVRTEEEVLPKVRALGYEAHITGNVHDEDWIDVDRGAALFTATECKKVMQEFNQFDPVPVIVDGEWSGTNWGEKTEIWP